MSFELTLLFINVTHYSNGWHLHNTGQHRPTRLKHCSKTTKIILVLEHQWVHKHSLTPLWFNPEKQMHTSSVSNMLCNPARTCYLSLTFMLFAYIKETKIFLDDFCGCVLMCNLNVPDLPLDECGVCSNAERWVSVCLNWAKTCGILLTLFFFGMVGKIIFPLLLVM